MSNIHPYCFIDLTEKAMLMVEDAINGVGSFSEGGTMNTSNSSSEGLRKSSVAWITQPKINKIIFDIANLINTKCEWNLGLRECEPMQYTLYDNVGDYYGWHIDQSKPRILPQGKRVRKISMTLWLSEPNEYEGGEFELELYGPDVETRTKLFKEKKGKAIFFLSDMWHQVLPIKSGVRKSLVAWFVGDPYV